MTTIMKTNTFIARTVAAVAFLFAPAMALHAQYYTGMGPNPGYGSGMTGSGTNGHGMGWYGTNWVGPSRGCMQFMTQVRQQTYAIAHAPWATAYSSSRWQMARTGLGQSVTAMDGAYDRFLASFTEAQVVHWRKQLVNIEHRYEAVLTAWTALDLEVSQARPRAQRVRTLADRFRATTVTWNVAMNSLLSSAHVR
jgi:hypothetical protein